MASSQSSIDSQRDGSTEGECYTRPSITYLDGRGVTRSAAGPFNDEKTQFAKHVLPSETNEEQEANWQKDLRKCRTGVQYVKWLVLLEALHRQSWDPSIAVASEVVLEGPEPPNLADEHFGIPTSYLLVGFEPNLFNANAISPSVKDVGCLFPFISVDAYASYYDGPCTAMDKGSRMLYNLYHLLSKSEQGLTAFFERVRVFTFSFYMDSPPSLSIYWPEHSVDPRLPYLCKFGELSGEDFQYSKAATQQLGRAMIKRGVEVLLPLLRETFGAKERD